MISANAMPFIFTNDDAGSGDVRLFHELLDFLRDEGVPGTFYVVPRVQDLKQSTPAKVAEYQKYWDGLFRK